jgi:hypothetical protein
MSIDRRRSPRIEILGQLQGHVVVPVPVSVTVREISLGGLSMVSPEMFPVGAIHDFRLTLGDESSVVLRGRIVYSRPDAAPDGSQVYVTGVQFVEDDPGPASPVGDLIDKIR